MPTPSNRPRLLIVTPEAAFVPAGLVNRRHCQQTLRGGFVAMLSNLINDLCEQGVDVHVTQPDYRRIFTDLSRNKRSLADSRLPAHRLHLAEDRVFFYASPPAINFECENMNIALTFQREVSHQIVPRVQPDLIHCHDWMTGLIPAMAKQQGIACLFTVHRLQSAKIHLAAIEDRGIDAAAIWQSLYYDSYPGNYKETRNKNPLDFLLSGILAAQHVTTANTGRLSDMAEDHKSFFYRRLQQLLMQSWQAGRLSVIAYPQDHPLDLNSIKTPSRDYEATEHFGRLQKSERRVQPNVPEFNQRDSVQNYIELYEALLQRPLVAPAQTTARELNKNGLQKAIDRLALSRKMTLKRVEQLSPKGGSNVSNNTGSRGWLKASRSNIKPC